MALHGLVVSIARGPAVGRPPLNVTGFISGPEPVYQCLKHAETTLQEGVIGP
jgi:hypothetical protein